MGAGVKFIDEVVVVSCWLLKASRWKIGRSRQCSPQSAKRRPTKGERQKGEFQESKDDRKVVFRCD